MEDRGPTKTHRPSPPPSISIGGDNSGENALIDTGTSWMTPGLTTPCSTPRRQRFGVSSPARRGQHKMLEPSSGGRRVTQVSRRGLAHVLKGGLSSFCPALRGPRTKCSKHHSTACHKIHEGMQMCQRTSRTIYDSAPRYDLDPSQTLGLGLSSWNGAQGWLIITM